MSLRPQSSTPRWLVLVAAMLGTAGPFLEQLLWAADGDELFQAHLAAGEFAPAMQLARQRPEGPQRDARFGQIAAAQAAAGARGAALRSTAEMAGDKARADMLRQFAPRGGRGGGAEPDFDALIELITSTIAPSTWEDVGGAGAIQEFEGGVIVDAHGVLRPLVKQDTTLGLAEILAAATPTFSNGDPRHESMLRVISLTRLEKELQLSLAAGRVPDEAMRLLAGLRRVQFVLVYPETGDIALAGPAGNWRSNDEGRIVSTETGWPVVRLEDLVVVLRALVGSDESRFGCSITPTEDGLARTRAFLEQSSKSPLRPQQRAAWLERLRGHLGKQNIEVYGIDPRTRAARVLVEADYRMKLVGMGLEEGVLGVSSYLSLVKVPAGQAPPPLDVLRWWFTLNYEAVLATKDRNAFELRGQGVQVLSENELLTARGQRVHTGKSDELNHQFAHSFTEHFPALCARYPIYAELKNIFDLALVAALLRAERLPERVDWHLTCFGDPEAYEVPLGAAPQMVDTVINHRVINKVHILAGVSGGVRVDPARYVAADAIEVDRYGKLPSQRTAATPGKLPPGAWWWDAR